MTRKTRSTPRRGKRGQSKWEKKANSIKYYKLKKNNAPIAHSPTNFSYNRDSSYANRGKYVLVQKTRPKSLRITPRQETHITASYIAWALIWIVVPATVIGIASIPVTTVVEPFSVVVSTGEYATFKVTTQTGDDDPEVNYYKYYVVKVEEYEDTNSILITFSVYNSSDGTTFSSMARTQQLNLTNTIADIGSQGASMTMGMGSAGRGQAFSGEFPSGESGFPSGGSELPSGGSELPSGFTPPTGFSAGGFRGGTSISQILVPVEFDFSIYEDEMNSQYSEMSSLVSGYTSDDSSSSSSTITMSITTSTKMMQIITYTDDSVTMDQYSEYSAKGLLVRQSSYSLREDMTSGESVETLTSTLLVDTTIFY